jgi:NAD(P)-dependent dehydrogenase (short-subunit alcohol dehydrogenase family)
MNSRIGSCAHRPTEAPIDSGGNEGGTFDYLGARRTVTNRVVVITGANRGIGLELTRQLAAAEDTVVLGSRESAKGEQAAAVLAEEGLDVLPRRLDVTQQDSLSDLADEIVHRFERVDVLVNNAAIHYDTWQQASEADLEVVSEALDTNLLGAWRTTLALLPLIRASEHGRIVNVSSGAGSLTRMSGGIPAYRASKAALNALTLMLADELRGDGILVNAVCPGWVATDMGGRGGRPVKDGAASVRWAIELSDEGPTGGFFRDGKRVPW